MHTLKSLAALAFMTLQLNIAHADDMCVVLAKNYVASKEFIRTTKASQDSYSKNVFKSSHDVDKKNDTTCGSASAVGYGSANFCKSSETTREINNLYSDDQSQEAKLAAATEISKTFMDEATRSVFEACIKSKAGGIATEINQTTDSESPAATISIYIPRHNGMTAAKAKFNGPPIAIGSISCVGDLVKKKKGDVLDDSSTSAFCTQVYLTEREPFRGGFRLAKAGNFIISTSAGAITYNMPELVVVPQLIEYPGKDGGRFSSGAVVPFPFYRDGRGDEAFSFVPDANYEVSITVDGDDKNSDGGTKGQVMPFLSYDGNGNGKVTALRSELATVNNHSMTKNTVVYAVQKGTKYTLRMQPICCGEAYAYKMRMFLQ